LQTVAEKIAEVGGAKVDLLIKYSLTVRLTYPFPILTVSSSNAGVMTGKGASFSDGIAQSTVEEWEEQVSVENFSFAVRFPN
jgi:hypothetical protein